jgi:copper chaperone NosL
MNKRLICIGMILFSLLMVNLVMAADDIKEFPSCKYCGMDRQKFDFSRTYTDFSDGKPEGYCSLHCMAIDLAVHIDRAPKGLFVADYYTKQLIDAEKAAWVVGGAKPGVMSKRAKWAFATKEGAERFVKESGGTPAGFEGAIKASYEDMYEDTKMIRDRRTMKKKASEHGH